MCKICEMGVGSVGTALESCHVVFLAHSFLATSLKVTKF